MEGTGEGLPPPPSHPVHTFKVDADAGSTIRTVRGLYRTGRLVGGRAVRRGIVLEAKGPRGCEKEGGEGGGKEGVIPWVGDGARPVIPRVGGRGLSFPGWETERGLPFPGWEAEGRHQGRERAAGGTTMGRRGMASFDAWG